MQSQENGHTLNKEGAGGAEVEDCACTRYRKTFKKRITTKTKKEGLRLYKVWIRLKKTGKKFKSKQRIALVQGIGKNLKNKKAKTR